ncbi:MAG: protein-glutamate O-methyltransferase CheR [Bacillota bacterium]
MPLWYSRADPERCDVVETVFQISDHEFQLISSLVRQRFGIDLGEHKRTLVIARLQKVLREGGFSDFRTYYDYVVNDPSGQALLTMVDRISTNHTFFFREKEHFDFFRTTALPRIVEMIKRKGQKSLRIWSAGCSSGEEPYTLAIVISDYFGESLSGIDAGILATDISVTALEKAKTGVYTKEQIARVPPMYRQRYFIHLQRNSYAVQQSIKDLVLFRRLNLMRKDYPFKERFHAIFCRNVMIYFDYKTRQELLERFHRYMEPGGYLVIGQSESISRSSTLYRYICPSIYQRV